MRFGLIFSYSRPLYVLRGFNSKIFIIVQNNTSHLLLGSQSNEKTQSIRWKKTFFFIKNRSIFRKPIKVRQICVLQRRFAYPHVRCLIDNNIKFNLISYNFKLFSTCMVPIPIIVDADDNCPIRFKYSYVFV